LYLSSNLASKLGVFFGATVTQGAMRRCKKKRRGSLPGLGGLVQGAHPLGREICLRFYNKAWPVQARVFERGTKDFVFFAWGPQGVLVLDRGGTLWTRPRWVAFGPIHSGGGSSKTKVGRGEGGPPAGGQPGPQAGPGGGGAGLAGAKNLHPGTGRNGTGTVLAPRIKCSFTGGGDTKRPICAYFRERGRPESGAERGKKAAGDKREKKTHCG